MDLAKATFLFGAVPDGADGLDPDDPEDRAELLAQQGEGRSAASLAVREILANQIANEDPPEVWATAQRLVDLGQDRARAMSELTLAVSRAIQLALGGDDRSFDTGDYVALLLRLPLPASDEIEVAVTDLVRAHQAVLADELGRLVLHRLGREPDDDLVVALVDRVTEALVDDDGPLAWLAGDRNVHVGDLIAGIVLTHRLTDEERETGNLPVSFDLAGFARCFEPRLSDGSELEVWEDDAGNRVWAGPPGWLAGFGAGALLAVRVDSEGVTTVEELAVVPPPDEGLVTKLRSVYDGEVEQPWMPVTAEELVLGVLAVDRAAFDHPGPPLEELCQAAGLERRGDRVAHEASVWAARRRVQQTWRVFDALEDQADRDAAARVLDLATDPDLSGERLNPALFDLAEPAVAQVVVDELVDPDRPDGDGLGDAEGFTRALVAAAKTPRQVAVARWVAAVVAERRGEVLVAAAHLEIAVEAGAAWVPLVERAAWYASDRGDASTALRLLRKLAEPRAEDVATLEPFARPTGPKLGRNDACWCGSGRKYKTCHVGQPPAVPLPERVGWLCRKAIAYLEHRGGDARFVLVALAMARAGEPGGPGAFDALVAAFADPIVTDTALVEGGWFVRFLADRGPLLPDDEALLAESWSPVARTVYEVLDVAPGQGLSVRDLRTGDRIDVRERTFSRQAGAGHLLCARAVPDGETHQFVGGRFPVAPGTEAAVLDLCDEGDPAAICGWVAALHRPPRLQTREGEPMAAANSNA